MKIVIEEIWFDKKEIISCKTKGKVGQFVLFIKLPEEKVVGGSTVTVPLFYINKAGRDELTLDDLDEGSKLKEICFPDYKDSLLSVIDASRNYNNYEKTFIYIVRNSNDKRQYGIVAECTELRKATPEEITFAIEGSFAYKECDCAACIAIEDPEMKLYDKVFFERMPRIPPLGTFERVIYDARGGHAPPVQQRGFA